MKLGEMLVSAGKITPAQLEETLKEQAIFGGRFGTNLVEMGYLNEHDLAHFLSKKTGFPHASSEQLMNIPPQVTRLIPQDVVRKHRVVPVALNNRKLSLAMTDPSDFAAIDEISFATGYIVVPLITPELRLICAMEKFYQIKRDLRYIPVAGGGRNRTRTGEPPAPPPPVPQTSLGRPAPSEPEDSDILDLPLLGESECFGDPNGMETQLPASLVGCALHRGGQKVDGLETVLRGLAQAHDRHSIARLIVGYAAQFCNRSALFLLRGDKASGWFAQVGNKPLPGFDTLEIPLDEPSILRAVADGKTYYLGPMPISPCNSRIIAALGGSGLTTELLVPLIMAGRVVAILHLEGDSPGLGERVPDLQKLLGKGSMAFEILILRSKILLT